MSSNFPIIRKLGAEDKPLQHIALDEHDMAIALGIHKNTLMKLRTAGKIPFVRFGRKVAYPVHQVQRWLDENIGRDLTNEGEPSSPA
ncbi:MAG: helix-turn-helix domain-containing protein [Planctomycetota bacterium]